MKASSRQRMLAAIDRRSPGPVPCSFMLYASLKDQCRDYSDFIERQVAMGMDPFVQLPPRPPVVENDHYNLHGLPVRYDPRVAVQEEKVHLPDEQWPILIKEYRTPAGTLRAEVRQTPDWRWGDHVPFLDDYIEPRSRKFLVEEPKDLAALRYLLVPPTGAEVAVFHAEAKEAKALAARHELLVAGGWGVGADLVGWVSGLERMVFAAYDNPEYLRELLDIIGTWNRARQQVLLDAGIDLFIKRAWYENCDFWTPASWREFLQPILKADVEAAHRAGTRFGYLITANCMPLLELLAETGVDVVIGVDPARWDLEATAKRLTGKVCLWGGVNGHLTVERGSADSVRAEVRRAMRILAPTGGFILSPVDNVREDSPTARANVEALIDEWRNLGPGLQGQGISPS